MYYDPMIAKVITWGKTRKECIDKMVKAISETIIVGVTTNQQFLLKVNLQKIASELSLGAK